MSKTIKTYSDLCEERERLKNLLVVQKQRMKDDWEGLKLELNPFKKAGGVIGRMVRPDRSNPLMNAGVKVATDLFISKFVMGKAGWVTKIALPFVLRNYSTHLLADKGKSFITRAAAFLNSKRKVTIKEDRRRDPNPLATEPNTTTEGPFVNPGPAVVDQNTSEINRKIQEVENREAGK